MKVVNKNKQITLTHSIAKFEATEGLNKFKGTVETFDAFISQETIKLNVSVEQHECPQKKISILLFRISPMEFGKEIWQQLEKIKLQDPACKD